MVLVLALVLLLLPLPSIDATTYDVSPDGEDGLDLPGGIEMAEAGDTVYLADGVYDHPIVTVRDGHDDSPITIEGGSGAILNGDNSAPVEVWHSFITLKGFTVDGKFGSSDSGDSYVDQCVRIEGPLEGFVMEEVTVQNCGGECVRLKNFVVGSYLYRNTIQDCGLNDYEFGSSGENGEGIYLGTSTDQWGDDPDESNDNVISENTISTNGNECVDIKEGSTGNVIERNTCGNQLDEDSGCYNCRGDDNIIRYNHASSCAGAGIRVGGDEVDGHQFGVGNSVYGNVINDADYAALKVTVEGQGDICGNSCDDDSDCILEGEGSSDVSYTWDQPCSDVDGPSSTASFSAPDSADSTSDGSVPSPFMGFGVGWGTFVSAWCLFLFLARHI